MIDYQPLISIIVPVFNSESYLRAAFDSVVNQRFQNYELLLIDDGSTDNSSSICIEYSNRYPQVKYFRKTNGGLCSARNFGLSKASGSYIMFLDNDDEYVENALSRLSEIIIKYNPDIIRFNRERIQFLANGKTKRDIYGTIGVCSEHPVFLSRNEFFANYKTVRKSGCFSGIWNGAFKKTLFDSIRFDESITAGGEDSLVNLQVYGVFDSIVFLPETFYQYYRRYDHSISTVFKPNQLFALIKQAELEKKLVLDNGLPETDYLSFAYVYLASIIKVFNRTGAEISLKKQSAYLDDLRSNSYGLQFHLRSIIHSNLSLFVKLYYLLFIMKCNYLFILLTNIVLRLRGNI